MLSPEEKVFVTDQIRGVASQVLPKNDFGVMTHENIESDKNLVAEYICQGRVGQIGSKLAVTVELLSVKGGVLVSSINFRADNIDGVLNELEKMLPNFFKPLLENHDESQSSLLKNEETNDSVKEVITNTDTNSVIEEIVTAPDSAVIAKVAESDSAPKDSNVVMEVIVEKGAVGDGVKDSVNVTEKVDSVGVNKQKDPLQVKLVEDAKKDSEVLSKSVGSTDSTVGTVQQTVNPQKTTSKKWNFSWGVYGAVTYNDVYGMAVNFKGEETKEYSVRIKGDDDLMGNFWGVGFNGGLGLLYDFNPMLSLHLELGMAYRYATGKSEFSAELQWADESKNPEMGGFGVTMDFFQLRLELPIMARVRVNPVYFEVGFLSSVCFKSSFESVVEYEDEESPYKLNGFADAFETGLIAALGTSRKIGIGTLDFSLRFFWALLPLGDFADSEPRTMQGQLNVTYWFM